MNDNKPEGGKWSYDNMNREPLKKILLYQIIQK